MFACREHWLGLPFDLRQEINAAWQHRLRQPQSPDARARHEAAKAMAEAHWAA